MYSSCVTPKGGFPHSEISGSKLICQLPEAYRRLSRPSSPVIAKASTTCTYSLDPITLAPLQCRQGIHFLSITLRRSIKLFTSSCMTQLRITDGTAQDQHLSPRRPGPIRFPSMIYFRLYKFLKNNSHSHELLKTGSTRDPVLKNSKNQTSRGNHQQPLVEDDGIEPTTPCLQSRCSPS
jgi:hypothetical protein